MPRTSLPASVSAVPAPAPIIVAYSCSKKKQANFFAHLVQAAADFPNVTLVHLPLCGTSPPPAYDALLHKRTEDMAAAATGADASASRRVRLLQRALRDAVGVDGFDGVWKLVDRCRIGETVDRAVHGVAGVRRLRWTVVDSGGVGLGCPVILKRRVACGSRKSHEMVICWDEDGIREALTNVFGGSVEEFDIENGSGCDGRGEGMYKRKEISCSTASLSTSGSSGSLREGEEGGMGGASFAPEDVVAQEFIPDHGGLVFKVYAIGEELVVRPRASVTGSLKEGTGSWARRREGHFAFDSQNINKEEVAPVGGSLPPPPSYDLAREVVRKLQADLGISLLGVDFVYDPRAGKHAVVDVNYFPGYKGVPDVHRTLLNHVVRQVEMTRSAAVNGKNSDGGGLC